MNADQPLGPVQGPAKVHSTPASPVLRAPSAIAVRPKIVPGPPRADKLPPWKVLLHNDDKNEIEFVVRAMIELAALKVQQATMVALEAHKTGVGLVCTTHQERAELYKEQFASKGLTVTVEPDRA